MAKDDVESMTEPCLPDTAFQKWLDKRSIELGEEYYVHATAEEAWQAATAHTLTFVANELRNNWINRYGENRPDIADRILKLKP